MPEDTSGFSMSHTLWDDAGPTSSIKITDDLQLEATISSLPDIVLSCIFQFLYWKEKIMAVEAFPMWSRVLDSSLGWKHFENNRSYAHSFKALVSCNYLFEEIMCIAQYGQYFTHCVIWLQNFLPTDNPEETDFALLGALEMHCFCLKSLVIYHPPNFSSSSIILSFVSYIQPLQKMFSVNPRLQLSLCRLLYSSVEAHAGALELLHFYLTHNVLQKVTCLDFSHGLIMASSVHPLNYLAYCVSIRVIKCPIQYLSTSILQTLLDFHLQEVYPINDEHTLSLNYVEKSTIEWQSLQLTPGRSLQVHYIFKNRSLYPVHICPNPYTHSLVFDGLCSSISRALLLSVADTYGATLQHLAFILSIWDPLVPFSELEDLASSFQYMASRLRRLHTVLLNLTMPKEALIVLAQHAPALKTLLVYEHKIFFGRNVVDTEQEIGEVQRIISEALGYCWKPVKTDETLYQIPNCRQNLLFEEHVSQWEGFW